jgi:riboflavin synthase|tara:strand:- start:1573 stop:2148 length:576 start_codon:yes stop_codon:yes gene_type:complete
MFTGIIIDVGTITNLSDDKLVIDFSNDAFNDLDLGTSVAVDGCCLTLSRYENNSMVFQVSEETFSRTGLNENHCGFVNLELPSTLTTFLSGHIVQGHVDSTITLSNISELENDMWTFKFEQANSKYIVDKGSITINGVSLTVVSPSSDTFEVAVINETYNRTNLKHLISGSTVNVEYDIIIKYLEKLNYDK